MPQTQVRMLPGGQRIAQKRTFQSKALGAQQQVHFFIILDTHIIFPIFSQFLRYNLFNEFR